MKCFLLYFAILTPYATSNFVGAQGLSRVSVRGILTDAHNEITLTQIEALNSTF